MESWINQTLNSDLDVIFCLRFISSSLEEVLEDENQAQTKYHTSKSELSV